MTRHSLDGQTALVIFKITHQDRAGETGTVIHKQGEVVAMNHGGQAVVATESGEIILAPAGAQHAVTAEMATGCAALSERDFVASAELRTQRILRDSPQRMKPRSRFALSPA